MQRPIFLLVCDNGRRLERLRHDLSRRYGADYQVSIAWDKSREPSHAAFRIVGPAHSPRSHRLRDDLTRISVPYWYFDEIGRAHV